MKAVAQDSEANRQRLVAMEKALTSGAIAAQRPVGGYGSDLSDSGASRSVLPSEPQVAAWSYPTVCVLCRL
jgi:hypothetical protein